MSDSGVPKIKVLIKPQFDSVGHVKGLSISLTIESPQVNAGSSIVSFPVTGNRTPLGSYVESLKAVDADGLLPVVLGNSEWTHERPTSGDVELSYGVTPLPANTAGPSLDLRCEQGGLLGYGLSFIPKPQSTEIYRNIVEWDLSEAPEGTRAVWTFGEGPAAVKQIGPASILSDSVYMVGPIHSNPPAPIPGTMSDYYGYYWFGKLPPNIEVIKDIHHDFFVKVSAFFEDSPSVSNPYRSFVRNTSSTKRFGGMNFTRSHIFDYDDQISVAHDYDLIRRMAYEMVHNFLGPTVTDPEID